MKLFCLILILLYSMLAYYPCPDGNRISKESHSATSDADHAGGSNEICSPFCTCNCCGSQIDQPTAFHFHSNVNRIHIASLAFHREHFIRSIHDDIWQPPKIG